MPRNVRNFFIHAVVDGLSRPIRSGPVSKEGGFTLTVYQRHEGEVVRALVLEGFASLNGQLRLVAYEPGSDESRVLFETTR